MGHKQDEGTTPFEQSSGEGAYGLKMPPSTPGVPGLEIPQKGHTGTPYTYGQKRGLLPETSSALEAAGRDNVPYQNAQGDNEDDAILAKASEALGMNDAEEEKGEGYLYEKHGPDDDSAEASLHGHAKHGAAVADDDDYLDRMFDDDAFPVQEKAAAQVSAAGHKGTGGQVVGQHQNDLAMEAGPKDYAANLEEKSGEYEEAEEKEELSVSAQPRPSDVGVVWQKAALGLSKSKVTDVPTKGQGNMLFSSKQ